MKPTIRNKLLLGFGGLLLLMVLVSAIGLYAVYRLRYSALQATRIGDRLNAISLEIQVHNLEAQRRVNSYLREVASLGPEKGREVYLDEADFEIDEIQSLTDKAIQLAPTVEKRAKFEALGQALDSYHTALRAAIDASEPRVAPPQRAVSYAAYQAAAEHLHESAEDGEMVGRDSSQTSQQAIAYISERTPILVISISLCGLLLASVACFTLLRAILIPVDHLRQVAENVSLGNLDIAVKRYSNDEIGDLADSFSRMVTAVKFFRMEASSAVEDVPVEVRSES